MWSVKLSDIPAGWFLCDGQNGTPDLRGRFIVGACADEDKPSGDQTADTAKYTTYKVDDKGGQASAKLEVENIPTHSHKATASEGGDHAHAYKDSHYLESYAPDNQPYFSTSAIRGPSGHDDDNDKIWYNSRVTDPVGKHSHSIEIANTGGGKPHEDRPPYYALAYIMYSGLPQGVATTETEKTDV